MDRKHFFASRRCVFSFLYLTFCLKKEINWTKLRAEFCMSCNHSGSILNLYYPIRKSVDLSLWFILTFVMFGNSLATFIHRFIVSPWTVSSQSTLSTHKSSSTTFAKMITHERYSHGAYSLAMSEEMLSFIETCQPMRPNSYPERPFLCWVRPENCQ